MKPIVRPNPTPSAAGTKVLLVRSAAGVRSVRPSDQPDRTALRLAIGVITALGIVAAVWLMGYLGYRLGFAPLIDVPDLLVPVGTGLVTGTMMLVSVPRVIILSGVDQPLWLMLGFLLIAVPAAGLSAARPRTPGGPRPSQAAQVFSYAGAVGAALNALVVIGWTASPARGVRMDQLRVDPRETERWLSDLTTVAGMDVLAVIISALWVVLVLRLAIPVWLRALSGSAAFFTLVVAAIAMSMSNASVAELRKSRSEVFLDDGSVQSRLLLGATPGHLATLRIDQGVAVVELHEQAGALTVIGRQSIVTMLEREAQRAR